MYTLIEHAKEIETTGSSSSDYHLQGLISGLKGLERDKDDLERVESSVEDLTSEVGNLDYRCDDLESKIDDLEGSSVDWDTFDVADYGGVCSSYLEELESEVRHHVHELEAKQENATENLERVESLHDDLRTEFDDSIPEIHERLEDLERQGAVLEGIRGVTEEVIEDQRSQLDNLSVRLASVEDLDDRLDNIEGGEIDKLLVCHSQVFELEERVAELETKLAEMAILNSNLSEYLANCFMIVDNRLATLETSDY